MGDDGVWGPVSRSGGPTVLVVDDERALADTYATWLAGRYDVLTAYGGEEAIETFRRERRAIDAVLLDRRMPDLDGDMVLVSRETLTGTVEGLLDLDSYEAIARELSSKRVRRNVLRVEKSEGELAASEAFARLERDIARLERRLERHHERVAPPQRPCSVDRRPRDRRYPVPPA